MCFRDRGKSSQQGVPGGGEIDEMVPELQIVYVKVLKLEMFKNIPEQLRLIHQNFRLRMFEQATEIVWNE